MTDELQPAETHPTEELARLSAGLGAVLDRRRRAGHRHLPRLGSASVEWTPAPTAAVPSAQQAPAPNPNAGEATPPGGETGPGARRSAPPSEIRSPQPTAEHPPAAPAPRVSAPRSTSPAAPPAASAAGASPAAPKSPAESAPATVGRRAALTADLSAHATEKFQAKLDQVAEAARAARDLGELAEGVASCTACRLHESRTQTVFADGAATARVMFIGEGPGADEDRAGVPFVGAAGRLLTGIIEKGMHLSRTDDVYVANVVKCRPPGDRDPTPHEKAICGAWLDRQIEFVDPDVIVPLGESAAQSVLAEDRSLEELRGRVHRLGGRGCVPTGHPGDVPGRSEAEQSVAKAAIWADIQLAMAELGL